MCTVLKNRSKRWSREKEGDLKNGIGASLSTAENLRNICRKYALKSGIYQINVIKK